DGQQTVNGTNTITASTMPAGDSNWVHTGVNINNVALTGNTTGVIQLLLTKDTANLNFGIAKNIADLSVIKTDNSTTYTPGMPVTYTIVVTNNSATTDVAGATFTENAP